jgi:hypothetical protein
MKTTNMNSVFFIALVLALLFNPISSLRKFKTKQGCWWPDYNYFTFQDNWLLSYGTGILTFSAWGRDIYVQITDDKSSNTWKYWIVIGGWDNTKSKVSRSDGAYLDCDFYHSIDLNRWNDYKLTMIAGFHTIKLEINGTEVWNCRDSNGYYATYASYLGISRWNGYASMLCNVQTWTYEFGKYPRLVMSKTAV